MKLKPIFILVFVFVFSTIALAQEKFVIQKWDLLLDEKGGKLGVISLPPTKKAGIYRQLDINDGMEFDTEEALLAFVKEKEKDLFNTRYYEFVTFTATPTTDNPNAYIVTMKVTDAFTLFPYVFPKLDSNSGLRIKAESIYANAFGSLTDWTFGGSIDYAATDPYGTIDSRISNWKVENDIGGIDIGVLSLSFSVGQYFEEQSSVINNGSEVDTYFSRYRTNGSLSTGLGFFDDLLSYGLGVSATGYYGYTDLKEERTGVASNYDNERLAYNISQSLGIGEVNWIKNYREGWSLGGSYNFGYLFSDDKPQGELDTSISSSVSVYDVLFTYLNPSLRLGVSHNFTRDRLGLGYPLRGVPDNFLSGRTNAYLNSSLTVSVFTLEELWGTELQLSPFFDVGWADNNHTTFMTDDIRYAVGMDIIGYMRKFQNLVARATIGVDLKALANPNVATTQAFEWNITSSRFY